MVIRTDQELPADLPALQHHLPFLQIIL